MSDQDNQVKLNENKKREQNKKLLMWAILVVVVVIVLYVVFGDKNNKLYRIDSNTRNILPSNTSNSNSSSASYTPYSSNSSSSLSVDNSASEVRKQLVNLFKSYA